MASADADPGASCTSELTPRDVDDGLQVAALLDQVTGLRGSFTRDRAYDQEGIYGTIA